MRREHRCPVEWAREHGLLEDSPMDEAWCIAAQHEAIMAVADADPKAPALRLWSEGRLAIYYAPFDWVNTQAEIMLVGICPGAHQASEALREARRCLRSECSFEETLRRADAVGSFSGPMRSNLVTMLDGIGVDEALGIDTTASLFDLHHELAAHVSAIDYPVFVDGENYRGASPRLTKHPTLAALVTACLGARVAMASEALVVPLGKAAGEAIEYLAARDLLARERCVLGFPHPSGANGHRLGEYAERRERLTAEVAAWTTRRGRSSDARSDLERFIAAETIKHYSPEPAEVDEGSVTAWATFGAAMAETTATLESADRIELVGVLERLTQATQALVDSLSATV